MLRRLLLLSTLLTLLPLVLVATVVIVAWTTSHVYTLRAAAPGLKRGDHVLVSTTVWWFGGPDRGELVAVRCRPGGPARFARITSVAGGRYALGGAPCGARRVARSALVGRVVLTFWPVSRIDTH
jgi:hypothetical protein